MSTRHLLIGTAISLALVCLPSAMQAQFAGTPAHDDFRDTTILRPPTGSKVALLVFEDLGCPACAKAHPYELQAAQQTHVPLLRYDFPLAQHVWTFQGAVDARYIQHTFGPQLASQYRSDVFASQRTISSKDDLQQFTNAWLLKHGKKKLPVAVDPNGTLAKEVSTDFALGTRLNVEFTPTVVVVTRDQYQVVCGTRDGANDPTQILPVVQAAIAKAH